MILGLEAPLSLVVSTFFSRARCRGEHQRGIFPVDYLQFLAHKLFILCSIGPERFNLSLEKLQFALEGTLLRQCLFSCNGRFFQLEPKGFNVLFRAWREAAAMRDLMDCSCQCCPFRKNLPFFASPFFITKLASV